MAFFNIEVETFNFLNAHIENFDCGAIV